MADKADQALKLAQQLEKDLKNLEKMMFKLHDDQESRLVKLHNEQTKEITDWANKSFATKG
jgi:uncharacterized FlaG/YvyC family protein